MSSLPEEIEFDILTRLLVKSLCRFKCVSKSWLSTISAPKFVDSHFTRSESRPKILITICGKSFVEGDEQVPDWWLFDEFKHFFVADLAAAAEQENGSYLSLTHQLQTPVYNYSVSKDLPKSVAGLTLGVDFNQEIRIANPSTKSQIVLPRRCPEIPSGGVISQYFAIGFDPVDSKYKVLEFLWIVDELKNRALKMESSVVTVGDYGNWRSVEDAPLIHHIRRPKQDICVNGVIYFIADVIPGESRSEEPSQCSMVAFDVRSENFQVVAFDIFGCLFEYYKYWRFMEYEGKVAVVDYPFQWRDDRVFESTNYYASEQILVLEDFENQVWSLRYSGLPSPFKITHECKLVGTTFSGEFVFARVSLRKDVPFSLLCFDPKTEEFLNREFRLPPGFEMLGEASIGVMGYVETLMSLKELRLST